jgi:hypothetical protein
MVPWIVKRGLQLIAIIVAGFLAAVLVIVYGTYRNHPLMPQGRWLGWSVATGFLICVLALDHRRDWSRWPFWLSLAGLFATHTAAYAVAFERIERWHVGWFIPIALAEYIAFSPILHWLGFRDYGSCKGRRGEREESRKGND